MARLQRTPTAFPEATVRKIVIRVCLALVVVVPAIAIGWWWCKHYARAGQTHTVTTGDLLAGVTVSGTIRCRQKVAVASEIVASVKRLLVKEGQRVTKGQSLVELDDSVVAAECAKAAARVELAEQHLAELEAGPRPEEIAKAKETLAWARSSLTYAQQEYDKLQEAMKRGAGTRLELDSALNRLNQAKAELGRAKAEHDLLVAGARAERIARAKAEVTLAKADVRRWESLRQEHVLRSPCPGIVTVRYVNPGEVVSPGQVLLRVENIEDVEVRAQVQEAQLPGVKTDCRVRVLADAYPDQPLEAYVEQVLPRVDPERGAVTVILKFREDPPVTLMDGMSADIAIIAQEKRGVLRVPAEAVEQRDGEATVWLRQGRSFVRRPIDVGMRAGRWVEVESGLVPGDVVRLP